MKLENDNLQTPATEAALEYMNENLKRTSNILAKVDKVGRIALPILDKLEKVVEPAVYMCGLGIGKTNMWNFSYPLEGGEYSLSMNTPCFHILDSSGTPIATKNTCEDKPKWKFNDAVSLLEQARLCCHIVKNEERIISSLTKEVESSMARNLSGYKEQQDANFAEAEALLNEILELEYAENERD